MKINFLILIKTYRYFRRNLELDAFSVFPDRTPRLDAFSTISDCQIDVDEEVTVISPRRSCRNDLIFKAKELTVVVQLFRCQAICENDVYPINSGSSYFKFQQSILNGMVSESQHLRSHECLFSTMVFGFA